MKKSKILSRVVYTVEHKVGDVINLGGSLAKVKKVILDSGLIDNFDDKNHLCDEEQFWIDFYVDGYQFQLYGEFEDNWKVAIAYIP